ncbi:MULTISPECIES: helix-turn-helix transcriptional regulator [unclassified Crossiella]|uniref:helix-turn-helix transcriptional regulator n=1 Tax=unclassified Crossiella TaxID=2620835 RepID=UPI001FFF5B94|nr:MULTISPECIES: helix-turn-helix transcriptional regulator [unclassified Crossiella]MCK2244240.1 helix-turn-helix transcriptional regulator [Crossiella sp. S99.2]MCK2258044.1 helix-turn-helix transcriptional regulator [Crossiella sp. S99.1]
MTDTHWSRWAGPNVEALRAVADAADDLVPTAAMFDGLGAHAGAVAVVVAVLGPEAPLHDAAELARLSLPEVLAAVDVLTAAGVLVNQVPLSFQEQDTADTVLNGLSVGARVTVRLRAAELLRALPGAAERTADQLVLIGPIGLDWAGEALCTAAAQAQDRGDVPAAAEYLRHALREPLPAAERAACTRRLASILLDTDPVAAISCLLQELRRPDTPAEVEVTCGLLHRLVDRLPGTEDALRLFEEAADQVRRHDPAAALRLLLAGAGATLFRPGAKARLSRLVSWFAETGLTGPVAERGLAAVRVCLAALCEPRAGDAVELATSVLVAADLRREWDTCRLALSALLLAGNDQATEHACRRLEAGLPLEGADLQRFGCVVFRAHAMRRQGNLRATVSTLDSLLAGCAERGLARDQPIVAEAAALLAETLVHTGALWRAEQVLADYGLDGEIPQSAHTVALLRARGVVALANGDLAAARSAQLDCGRLVDGWAELNTELATWQFDLVGILLRSDRHEEAVAVAKAGQTAAAAWGTARALGFGAYGRALTSRGDMRMALLAEAVRQFAEAGAAMAEAHARYDLALALREAGAAREQEAVRHLARARELFERCGGVPVAGSLDDPARAPAARALLTPQERRIARLAAGGLGNAEIAAELSLARRTIEFHLSSVYRKLAITGRHDLLDWPGPELG